MRVEIKCQGSHELALEDLTIFQGDLKSLSEVNYRKLRKEILELGFSSPIHVWNREGTNYILDGTQRTRTLLKMAEEGIEVPRLPIVRVEAKDLNDAAKKVLALTSQYGKIETQGLYEFMSEADISVDEIEESFHFPELSLSDFREEYFEPPKDDGPEPVPPDDQEFLVVCELRNETEQAKVFEQLTDQGVKCKIM